MDLIYNINRIGNNIILADIDLPAADFLILAILSLPVDCGLNDKGAIIDPEGCNGNWRINFQGIAQAYEDLLSGQIFFSVGGTWTAALYHQQSTTNVDPDNATFLKNINLQVL